MIINMKGFLDISNKLGLLSRFSLDDKSWEVVQPAADSEVKTTNTTLSLKSNTYMYERNH